MPSRVRAAVKKSQRSSLPEPAGDDEVFVVVREESGGGVKVIRRSDTTSKKPSSKLDVGDTVSFQAGGQVNRGIVLLLGMTRRVFICICIVSSPCR